MRKQWFWLSKLGRCLIVVGILVANVGWTDDRQSVPGQDISNDEVFIREYMAGFTLGLGFSSIDIPASDYRLYVSPPADMSPMPSAVDLDQPDSSMSVNLLIAIDIPMFTLGESLRLFFAGEFSAGLTGGDMINLWGGAGFSGEYILGKNFVLSFKGLLGFAGLSGAVGQVGAVEGDVYLTAPDGENYPVGSKLHVSDATFGVLVGVGGNYYLNRKYKLVFDLGYLISGKLDDWSYHIKSPDDSGESSSTDLPKEGFSAHPKAASTSGLTARLGITYMF